MSESANKGNGRKWIPAALAFAAIAVIFGGIYLRFSPAAVAGEKNITIEVVDDKQETTVYTLKTDAEYLKEAMEDAGISVTGTTSEYGLMVDTVNGVYASYSENGAYWAFYEGDDYCNYGVDQQVIQDGKTYRVVYTLAE